MPVDEHKIYELIENERKERRQDIGEIHNRIDQILDAINKLAKAGDATSNASWVRQSVGLTIATITILGALSGIVIGFITPIHQQLGYLSNESAKIELRAERLAKAVDDKIQGEIRASQDLCEIGMDRLDEKLQIELQTVRESTNLEAERAKARLDKLEDWGIWWHRSLLLKDINERGRIIE